MAKKLYKLVYEDSGLIKGSYSGIPNKDDPVLIERAVLEGWQDPSGGEDLKPEVQEEIVEKEEY